MSRIDWILFDLGGVLLEVHQPRIFNHLQRLTDVPASVIEERLKSAAFFRDDFMVKEFSPTEITRHVNEILGQVLTTADVVDALNAELGAEISTTASLLPDLQRKAHVGCLSNTNSIHWDRLLQSYPFMDKFDRRFASQLLGCAKPGREIYEKVAGHLNAQPRQILFFDDKIENVETAKRLGWHARLYVGHEQLMADLAEFQ
jgi:HAD superfamily hydrolase (TIGR01509 family)